MRDSEELVVPSDRDVRATLDAPGGDGCVVACPPHPQMGGSRTDARLRAVSDALDRACLRIDYGAWDGGPGELGDVRDAYAWARSEYDDVSLFGYSFGGCLALVAAARASGDGNAPSRVAALAPAARLTDEIDAVAAIGAIHCPVGVVYGGRDTTVDAAAVGDAVREAGGTVEVLSADHHFVGQTAKVAARFAALLSG